MKDADVDDTTVPFHSARFAVAHIARQLVPPTEIRGERSHSKADMGLLATLRRFHPAEHGRACAFETTQVLHEAGVEQALGGSDAEKTARLRLRWAVLVHCLALVRGAHQDGGLSPGAALAGICYSEGRLRLLLQADAELLIELMPSLARRLAAERKTVDWWPLAKLLLNTGLDERQADEARDWIARDYIGVAAGSAPAITDDTDRPPTGSPA